MPRLNRHGWIISQLGISWLNDETEIGQRDIGGDVYRICTRPHGGTWSTHPVNRSCNALASSQDHWLAWEAGRGVFGSTQLTDNPVYGFPHGGDGRGAASLTDGTIALASSSSNVGLILRRADGTERHEPDAWLTDKISVLDRDRAIWVDSRDGRFRTLNLPPCVQLPGSVEFPTVLILRGQPWICYQNTTQVSRTVLHPFDSLVGYQFDPGYYIHAVALTGEVARVIWATDPAETVFQYRDVDLSTPPIDLSEPTAPIEPIVPIGRAMWLGWHTGTPTSTGGWITNIYPTSVPGNAYASILGAPEPHALIYDFGGTPIAVYTEGEVEGDITSIEARIADARAKHPGLPVMIYWPQAAWHTVPSAEWCGVEAYWGKDESREAFVSRVLGAVEKAKQAGRLTVPIFHCFTSNTGLQQDLTKIPPLASQLARDHLSIDHLWVFNGTGRATGLQDHPEVRPLWEEVFTGIAGPPAGGGGSVQTDPPYQLDVIQRMAEQYPELVKPYHHYPSPGDASRARGEFTQRCMPELHDANWGMVGKTHGEGMYVPPGFVPHDVDGYWIEGIAESVIFHHPSQTKNGQVQITASGGGAAWMIIDSADYRHNNPWMPAIPWDDGGGGGGGGGGEPVGGILIHHCDPVAQRSNPSGHLVRYEVLAGAAVTKLELKLVDDQEPAVEVLFSDKPGQDGRYIRGVAWKPVRNGTYRLRLRAWDVNGAVYENAEPWPDVTVTE